MNEKMSKALTRTLRQGESVIWESPTKSFGILDDREGRKTLAQWIISSLCYIGMLSLFAVNNAITPRFVILLSLVYSALIITPILSYRQILGQRYYVTNERAILIRKDGIVCTMEREKISSVRLYSMKAGAALAIGKSVIDEGDKQLRWRSLHAKENPNSTGGLDAMGLVFYNIEQPEKAMRALEALSKDE